MLVAFWGCKGPAFVWKGEVYSTSSRFVRVVVYNYFIIKFKIAFDCCDCASALLGVENDSSDASTYAT